MNIQDYDAIVTVSGDGLIHEVLNGFLQRSDARQAVRKVPIGAIPCGTSNSLAISMLGEKLGFDPVQTALQVVKGETFFNSRVYQDIEHGYRSSFGLGCVFGDL